MDERLTDRKIAEMLRNTEGESWDSDNIEAQCYIRLAELEDKIESGEIIDRNEYLDYLMEAKDTSALTDKEIEFFIKHNARVREAEEKAFKEVAIVPVREILHRMFQIIIQSPDKYRNQLTFDMLDAVCEFAAKYGVEVE